MLETVSNFLSFPEGYEFLSIWCACLICCFVIINLLSLIAGIFRQIGGFK